MIFLDLEFNNGMFETEYFDEVLQIGAVQVDSLGGMMTGTFNTFIRPRINKRLSPGARFLPELEESMERGMPFEEAYALWLDFIEGETEFAEWGRDDYKILSRNAIRFGLEPVYPGRYIDVQTAFSRALGSKNGAQLYQAAEYCRVPDTFCFHDALNDAMYTSLVAGCLPRKYLRESVIDLRPADIPPPPRPPMRKKRGQVRMGPFQSLDQALNNMGCRRAVCPQCRRVGRIAAWHTQDGVVYLGAADCPVHGPVIRRMKVLPDEGGRFWTYNDILPATDRNLRLLERARSKETYACVNRCSPSDTRRRKEYRSKSRHKKKK